MDVFDEVTRFAPEGERRFAGQLREAWYQGRGVYGGVVAAGQATIDPDSPIGSMTSGTEALRVIVQSGEFPYFCDVHWAQGMTGSLRVVPQLFADGFD